MNIYWCHESDDHAGMYVLATSRGRAKVLFAHEMDCDYTDVRSSVIKRGVPDYREGCLYDDDAVDIVVLQRCGLEYLHDEEEE